MEHIKKGTRYVLMITIMVVLLWLSLRGLEVEGEDKVDYLWNAWQKSNKLYLWLMAGAGVLSHILRALRWKMLLEPTGQIVKLSNSFWSLMTGYLVNLAVPRGGEVSRCYTLYELEKTPVEISFGTVVTERIADVVCLLVLIAFSFYMEWEKLKRFMDSLPFSSSSEIRIPTWAWAVLALGIAFLVAIYFLRKNEKFLKLIHGFRDGLLSVVHLKSKWLFVFY